ncbi:hypothetical protein [Anaerovorax sp. IOR16]|uniref:hypothetical protein n=1 Tax=Anaerovorax sp. IOR16 TaxID=2773458 RepID=UPI0019D0E310|nr:hypothetical protein [Anaerovorax sp. IOR16]
MNLKTQTFFKKRKWLCVLLILLVCLPLLCLKWYEFEHGKEKIYQSQFSIDELTMDWIDPQITIDELEKNQEYIDKVVSEDTMYITYEMDHFLYTFTTDKDNWGNLSHKLILVEIFKNKDQFSGPRDIKIGDDFNSVIEKFPQDYNWEDNAEGLFYGESGVIYDSKFEKGSVTKLENGMIEFITLVPKGYPPFMKIYFENNKVTHMIIYYILD